MYRQNKSPVQISIDNLTVKFNGKSPKDLLTEVSAVFRPGRVCAILGLSVLNKKRLINISGPSGAGKTVLISILAGQVYAIKKLKVEGKIRVNSEVISDITILSLIAGLVPQDDMIMGSMTVEEVLRMSARLRRPREKERVREDLIIEDILNRLGISKARKTKIGTPERKGISGGERKRTAIAVEIIANSSVIIMDEPTSGLDAFTQLSIARLLKGLAMGGETIVASVHAPSAEMLEYFDDLLVLGSGRVVYHGETKDFLGYLEALGNPCPQYVNPMDFLFLEVIHDKESEFTTGDEERVVELEKRYKQTPQYQKVIQAISNPPSGKIQPSMLKFRAPFKEQLKLLIPRAVKNIYRSPEIVYSRLAQTLVLGIFVALVYLDVIHSATTAGPILLNITGALYFIAINQTFTALNNTLTIFTEEKLIFQREYVSGFYSLPAYFISTLFVEIPMQMIFPIITACIVYYIIGFQPGFDKFLIFTAVLILLNFCGSALGLFVGGTFNKASTAAAVAPLILLPLLIYGGFFVDAKNSPPWLAWLLWASPLQYAFTALTKNELLTRTIYGVPGTDELRNYHILDRFSIGVSSVFLIAIWLALLVLAYMGLVWTVSQSGLSRQKLNRVRKRVLENSK